MLCFNRSASRLKLTKNDDKSSIMLSIIISFMNIFVASIKKSKKIFYFTLQRKLMKYSSLHSKNMPGKRKNGRKINSRFCKPQEPQH